jgi:deoxycytidylate deaminase
LNPPAKIVALAVQAGVCSPCAKSKRGAVTWIPTAGGGAIAVGTGCNAPAIGDCDGSEACRRDCGRRCVHAEQAALLSPLNHRRIGAEMLHVKVVDGQGVPGGPPSCVECSKLILAAGIVGMWLWEGKGWIRRTAAEFHRETVRNVGIHDTAPDTCGSCGGAPGGCDACR